MNIAILGATGAVGREMLKALDEERISVDTLKLLSSRKSAGTKIAFQGEEYVVEEACENSFEGMDVVLGASGNDVAKRFAPFIVKSSAIFIDNSSAFRMNEDVPLIVPEINKEDIRNHHGIISNPNCSTIIACMAVYGINRLSPIRSMIASTYQAVSGAGNKGIEELKQQILDLEKGNEIRHEVFPYQIAYNCIPCIGSPVEGDWTTEEMKMENEGRKIMHLPELRVSCTCVRVPVYRSHSISISLQTEDKLDLQDVKEAIGTMDGVVLYDDLGNGIYPMPLECSDQNKVYVGRIREDRVLKNGIALWCAGDQIRKGAAVNAVQILKCL